MHLFVLDSLLRRSVLIDWYNSLIWKEAYSSYGDFELVILANTESRNLFIADTLLAINESARVMIVETVEDSFDDEGRAMLSVKGRSLEKVLIDRIARKDLQTLEASPKWSLMGRPGDIIRQIFENICVDGMLSPGDIIPFITGGNMYPPDTIPEEDGIVTMSFEPDTVYKIIKEVAEAYKLGFRLTRDGDTGKLYFNVYSGSDKTTSQNTFAPVIFSRGLENLRNVSEIKSLADYKNVCYVLSKKGTAVVYSGDTTANVSGFNKRSIVLKLDTIRVNDVELEAGPELQKELERLGREELTKHKAVTALDGEIAKSSQYVYDTHYSLGDLVEMRSESGATNRMRVVEQIWVSDAEGVKSYPTLSVDIFITPGSWLAWDFNQTWPQADFEWINA